MLRKKVNIQLAASTMAQKVSSVRFECLLSHRCANANIDIGESALSIEVTRTVGRSRDSICNHDAFERKIKPVHRSIEIDLDEIDVLVQFAVFIAPTFDIVLKMS